LQLSDLRLRLVQRLIGEKRMLDKHIGAVWVYAHGILNHRRGFRVLGDAFGLDQIVQKLGQE
jgi:hypothetical protein